MQNTIRNIFKENSKVSEDSLNSNLKNIEKLATAIIKCFKNGGKVIVFGNGGSAADSQHFVAELVGRFQKERMPLPAISLTTNTSILTAIGNDYGYEATFSRQLEAIGKKGDVAIGISTSGNSKNVLEALRRAKSSKLFTAGLSGGDGGKLKELADVVINIPSDKTPRIQESHILIIHILCKLIEDSLFSKNDK